MKQKRSMIARRGAIVALSMVVALTTLVSAAFAGTSTYGPWTRGPSGNNYLESDTVHTWWKWTGVTTSGNGDLACQVFEKNGTYNLVRHGYASCQVLPGSLGYTPKLSWGRVYNQSSVNQQLTGEGYW